MHYNVGKEVRTAIEKIGGNYAEDLPRPGKYPADRKRTDAEIKK